MLLLGEFKHTEDCENCPLHIHEMCSGGFSQTPNGYTEPPCTSFDDDTDLEEYVDKAYAYRFKEDELEEKEYKLKAEQERKKEVTKRRKMFSKSYCIVELGKVKELKNRIKALKRLTSLTDSFKTAFNLTNKMFGYENSDEKVSNTDANVIELQRLENELKEAELKLKAKRKECKETELYKQIN